MSISSRISPRKTTGPAIGLLSLCAAAAISASPATAPAQGSGSQPNIVMFMADDLGWLDSTVYGSEYYNTPNIERLAQRGVVFTSAYSANPLCSPTRASIMTGKYPGRLNFTAASGHVAANPDAPPIGETGPPQNPVVIPTSRNQLAVEEYTVAEALNDAGYDTIFLGKWHLGSPSIYWPDQQGFDINIGGAGNPGPPSYFSPYGLNNLSNGPAGEYITDRMANEAVSYIQNRSGDPDPFFMCLWQWNVHAPYQAEADLIQDYRGVTDPRGFQDCPTMGAMVEAMDRSLGQVMDELDAQGLWDDTIFVFYSDNGGNMYDTVVDPVSGIGTTPTNNAPLSDGKGHIKEGGVRVPAIVSWPGVVTGGTTSDEIISSIDWFPTFLEWGSATTQPGQIVDGVSLANHLQTGASLTRDAIYCHFPHYVAATENLPTTSLRMGDWKFYRVYGEGPNQTNVFELYDLSTDIGETNNVADQNPALVAQFDGMIQQHLEDTGSIIPFPNPNFSDPVAGWYGLNNIDLREEGGMLRADLLAGDPFMGVAEPFSAPSPAQVRIRMRIQGSGNLQLFWVSDTTSGYAGARSEIVPLTHDAEWRTLVIDVSTTDTLEQIRIDPGGGIGAADFDWIRVTDPTGSVIHQAWEFGGPEDGSPFEPFLPFEGWDAQNLIEFDEQDGYLTTTVQGEDPFMVSPAIGPHDAPIRAELRLRSSVANDPLQSQLMWSNSQGSFGIGAGRGFGFNQTHDGEWNVYSFDLATPDINRLRFDPLQFSTAGQTVDIDYIRLYGDDGLGRRAEVLLEDWDFDGSVPGSSVSDWRMLEVD